MKSFALPLIIGLVVGIFAGNFITSASNKSASGGSMALQKDAFTNQSASILGDITKVSGNSITVKNNKGVSSNFTVGPNVTVLTFPNNSGVASQSAGLAKVVAAKNVSIVLNVVGDKYQIVTIAYLPTNVSTPVAPPAKVINNTKVSPTPAQ